MSPAWVLIRFTIHVLPRYLKYIERNNTNILTDVTTKEYKKKEFPKRGEKKKKKRQGKKEDSYFCQVYLVRIFFKELLVLIVSLVKRKNCFIKRSTYFL